jgi:hypothetical protein
LYAVKQPTVLDGFAFDPFSFQQDGLTASEVDVGRGEIMDALVIAVVVRDEFIDLSFAQCVNAQTSGLAQIHVLSLPIIRSIWIRVMSQNHSIIKFDGCNSALASDVHRQPVQVA